MPWQNIAHDCQKPYSSDMCRQRDGDPESRLPPSHTSCASMLTRFFRNTRHFRLLAYHVLPALVASAKRCPGRALRIWSAGCSTGEEAYSLAMLVDDLVSPDIPRAILASDQSEAAIRKAKEGRYPTADATSVGSRYIQKHFFRDGGWYRIRKETLSQIRFFVHELAHDPFPAAVDLVLCRNVLTYLPHSVRRNVLGRISDCLNGGGYLILGGSELSYGIDRRFHYVETEWGGVLTKVSEEV